MGTYKSISLDCRLLLLLFAFLKKLYSLKCVYDIIKHTNTRTHKQREREREREMISSKREQQHGGKTLSSSQQ